MLEQEAGLVDEEVPRSTGSPQFGPQPVGEQEVRRRNELLTQVTKIEPHDRGAQVDVRWCAEELSELSSNPTAQDGARPRFWLGELKLLPDVTEHGCLLAVRNHRSRHRRNLRPFDLVELAAHQTDQVEHVAELVGRLAGVDAEKERVQGVDGVAGSGGQVKVRPAQRADHAAVLSFGIEHDRTDASRVAAEHDGSRRVSLAGAGGRQDSDVGVAESILVKGIEDAEASGLLVVTPVMTIRIRQVL